MEVTKLTRSVALRLEKRTIDWIVASEFFTR